MSLSFSYRPRSRSRRNHTPPFFFLFLGVVAILCSHTHARFSTRDLISDGSNVLRLPTEADSTCEQTYGFLPCTTTVLGNLFLILVYGFLMYTAATFLSNGSELLLEILGPGIVGGLFLPILGALPDAMLILVSGLSGSTEVAQSQVSVGMGLLAGSTVLLLTIIWGTCVIVGKCDIEDSIALDSTDTRGFHLTGSGVSTDIWTSYAARIMIISVIPFVIVQLPQILHSNSGRHLAVLIGFVVSVCLLISYCLYQIFQPWIQRRKLEYIKHKHVIVGLLRHLKMRSLGRLLKDDGQPDKEVIKKLFATIDENKDGHLTHGEMRALVVGIQFEEIDLDHDDAVTKIMADFDTSRNQLIDEGEFVNGVCRWLLATQRSRVASGDAGPHTVKFLSDFHTETKREHDLLDVGGQSVEGAEGVENARWISIKAGLFLLLGSLIAAKPFPNSLNLPALTTLYLGFVVFHGSDNGRVEPFLACHRLNSLTLDYYKIMDAKTLCISNFMLVNLNMRSSYLGECFEMELSTPNLCTFEFGVTPLPKLCGSKSNLSSIKHGYIDVSMLVNDADTPLILLSWLLQLANIKWLTITSRTLEVLTLIPDLLKVEFHSLCKLKSLDVKINSSFISKSEILRDAKL